MRRWLVAVLPLVALGLSCGSDPPQCLLDTDCPLTKRCAMERCVDLGVMTEQDAGEPATDGSTPPADGAMPRADGSMTMTDAAMPADAGAR